jgi:uncharacterized protein
MKIIIAGATGFIGRALVNALENKAELVIISRNPMQAARQFNQKLGLHVVGWDDPEPLIRDSLANTTAIINLSGASIAGKRWTAAYKKQIINSRIQSIDQLLAIVSKGKLKPEVVVQASATGYYALDDEKIITESSPPGDGFLAEVSRRWEAASMRFNDHTQRLVTIRSGVVLGKSGGALPKMALPVKLFAGGPSGSGKQWMPWIHLDDQLQAIIHLLKNSKSQGAYNLTAPNPVRQAELMKTIARTLGRPYWIRTPSFAIKALFGEMGEELLLKGNKVIPEKLLAEGFEFKYTTIESAIQSIYKP